MDWFCMQCSWFGFADECEGGSCPQCGNDELESLEGGGSPAEGSWVDGIQAGCPECGKLLPEDVEIFSCPSCGYDLDGHRS